MDLAATLKLVLTQISWGDLVNLAEVEMLKKMSNEEKANYLAENYSVQNLRNMGFKI